MLSVSKGEFWSLLQDGSVYKCGMLMLDGECWCLMRSIGVCY